MQQIVVVRRRAEHAEHHFGDVAFRRRAHAVHQVQRGVGRRPIGRTLAAHQHDRHGRVLHHEAQDRAGVAHRVGAVADDDAVDALGDFLADGLGQGDVLLGAHVLAEDAEELLRVHVGDVGQLRHRAVKFAGRKGRNHRAGAVVEPRGDRAAGAQQRDALLARIDGKCLLRNLVDGLAIADFLGRRDPAGFDAHVVAVEELHDDVELVARLAAGQHHALEAGAAVVDDLDFAPDAEAETVHHVPRRVRDSLGNGRCVRSRGMVIGAPPAEAES